MSDAVIVAAARTPIGTARKGTLLDVTTFELAKYAAGEALKRSGISAGDVDDMMMGESLQGGGDVARYAAIDLGLIEVPGLALNRHCASGMGAVQNAAGSIIAGMDTVVIAGGSESMSSMPMVVEAHAGHRRLGPVDVAVAPRAARRPRVRHVDHGRLEHREGRRAHPRRLRRVGRALAPPCDRRRSTKAASTRRSSRSK